MRSLRAVRVNDFQRLQLFNARISLDPSHRDAYSLDPNSESRFGFNIRCRLAGCATFQQNSKHMLGRRQSGVRIGMLALELTKQ